MSLYHKDAEYLLPNREATLRFGYQLGSLLQAGDIIALSGDLGAGKTTLTQAIAQGMGITEQINSPTFALIHEHYHTLPLFHADVYRLESPDDLYDLGFEELLTRKGVVVVEWAERIASVLPKERLSISLQILSELEVEEPARLAQIEAVGDRGIALLNALEARLHEA